ncbi:CDG_1a_G0044490.mRNA.1.CDS.1 [Saccharomyces cerevisiae]|nr:BMC_2a_G0044490.mRNA.1.CDS.1 [Saccharomyces cerevisiae]CAI4619470.1 BMB_G0044480.mRNA.1.CDS.1 [Saccharomyces cerevisiae]CAI4691079.1 BAL_1a_G0043760.mRNA.1.CDS.1 [Saccharomyces cerevisiae]CAI4691881.1 CFA_G0044260.mRNA.1.CDS.1 [Saccharomyces cerevisiae]CAI4701464.1 AVI_1a_G0043980.mRNA.1.CDS.1 [Saccharomyces cerevisiae]
MSIVLRKSNKKKQKLHNKQVLYNTHYKNFYSGVPSSHCHWRKPLCGVELPTGCFQERHGYKKKDIRPTYYSLEPLFMPSP